MRGNPGFLLICSRQPAHDEFVSERNIVYFDLETQKSFQQVGGHSNVHKLRVSVAVTYSTRASQYMIYTEPDIDDLIRELSRADLVVGFNLMGFDYKVLTPYTVMDPAQWPTLDILKDVELALGRRVGLDALAAATLGVGKSADGAQALRWFKEGKLREIAHYCCVDVKVTRLLHEFGRQNGFLRYLDKDTGKPMTFAVNWA